MAEIEYKGIKVYRSPIIPRGNGNGFNLFLNYISFVFFGFFKLLLIKDKFAVINLCGVLYEKNKDEFKKSKKLRTLWVRKKKG